MSLFVKIDEIFALPMLLGVSIDIFCLVYACLYQVYFKAYVLGNHWFLYIMYEWVKYVLN